MLQVKVTTHQGCTPIHSLSNVINLKYDSLIYDYYCHNKYVSVIWALKYFWINSVYTQCKGGKYYSLN